MLFPLLAFLFGLIIGSFLNVCICRLPEHRSLVTPGSSCPSCGARLRPRDLVPVASYLALHGRCRYCKARVSPQYPIVELATATLFWGVVAVNGLSALSVALAVFVSLLVVVAGADINTGLIPNTVTLPGIAAGIVLSTFVHGMSPVGSIIGIVVCGGVVWLIMALSRGGMGGGDVKLMGMIGAFLGWKLGLLTLFIGALMGSVVGVARIAAGKQKRRDPMPFGPYLAAAGVVSAFAGTRLLALLGWA